MVGMPKTLGFRCRQPGPPSHGSGPGWCLALAVSLALAGCDAVDQDPRGLVLAFPSPGKPIPIERKRFCDYIDNEYFRGWATGERFSIRPRVLLRSDDEIASAEVALTVRDEGLGPGSQGIRRARPDAPLEAFEVAKADSGQEISFDILISPFFLKYSMQVTVKTVTGTTLEQTWDLEVAAGGS